MIDSRALIIGDKVEFGKNCRVDAFSLITGRVKVGGHVHIGAGVYILGTDGVEIGDHVSISPKATLYTGNDDFVNGYFIGTQAPAEYRNVSRGSIYLSKHAAVGTGAVILPGVRIGYGAVVGAMSLIKADVEDFAIVVEHGRVIGYRNRERLNDLTERFNMEHGS